MMRRKLAARAAAFAALVAPVAPAALAAALAALAGCDGAGVTFDPAATPDKVSALVVDQRLPPASATARPWAPQRCEAAALAADVLACVDGVAVTRAAFDHARAQAPETVDNRAIVEALVRAEVLAGEALARGLWGDWLLDPFRSALVRRLLKQQFIERFQPKDVRQSDIERAWIRGPIRIRYAHETAYQTIDAQFLCCTGDWRRCEIDAKVAACAEAKAPQALALAEEMAANPPASASEFRGRVMANKHRFPDATIQEVSFYYDVDKPYDKQGDYDRMLEPWTLPVVAMNPGTVSPPIRTPYGWHVVRLNTVLPRIEGKPTDPEVRDDIASGILDGVRERDVQLFAVEQMRARNTQLFYDNAGL